MGNYLEKPITEKEGVVEDKCDNLTVVAAGM